MENQIFVAAMEQITEALKERGYDPYAQLYGYLKENEPTYITSHKGARQLILTLDKKQVELYVAAMKQ